MSGFSFKQFHLDHDRCAMKVGTDGVLLGAWTELAGGRGRVLDIGSGCGLVALMLAQRSTVECRIVALEIDPAAAQQALENVERSPWPKKVDVVTGAVQEYNDPQTVGYDLIVSNPPYYPPGQYFSSHQRAAARQGGSLPPEDLLQVVLRLLGSQGIFSVILPVNGGESFVRSAKAEGLYLLRRTEVRSLAGRKPVRVLLSFGRYESESKTDDLVIADSPGVYSSSFISLTRDFYRKML